MTKTNWLGKRVVVLGAARQGLALARYLAIHGAHVTLSDSREQQVLNLNQENWHSLGVTLVLGGHPLELLDNCDALFLSGGVSPNLEIVKEAQRKGILISNDSQVFLEEVPCKVIGITGSAGKTTTTTLLGRMAEAGYPHKVWVGGNIGLPLISFAQEIQPQDLVVLELSSFQLELMTLSPHVAAILNITPNHLDRHGTMQAYTDAKLNILKYQAGQDIAVLNRDDAAAWKLSEQVNGELYSFGLNKPASSFKGTYLSDEHIMSSDGSRVEELFPRNMVLLRGAHNLQNVLAACALGLAAGLPKEALLKGVAGFKGVEHRLEMVRNLNGATWYNDSIATAPERTAAALHSFSEPIILLLGGRDKNLPWQDLAHLVKTRVKHVVTFGEAAGLIERSLLAESVARASISKVNDLHAAVTTAHQLAIAGDVVLLSPGGTSFDEFVDFAERGERYKEWVNKL